MLAFICTAAYLAPAVEAAFPGRNGRIAFVKQDRELNSTIWGLQLGGKRARPLSAKPRHCRRGEYWAEEAPDYSPTGNRIVYSHADDCGRGSRRERVREPGGDAWSNRLLARRSSH